MNLLSKLLIGLFFTSTFLFLYIRPASASITYTISPTDVDENTPVVTITIYGLVTNETYKVCNVVGPVVGVGSQGCKGVIYEETVPQTAGNTIQFTVCGDEDFKLKTGCGAGDFFGAGTYTAYIFRGDKKIYEASFKVEHKFPEVYFSPERPKPDDRIIVSICGNRRPADRDDRNKIDFDFFALGGLPDPEDPDDLRIPKRLDCSPGGSWQGDKDFTRELKFDDGPLDSGSYLLNIRWDHEDFVLYQIRFDVDEDGGKYIITTSKGKSSGDDTTTSLTNPDPVPGRIVTPIGDIETSAEGLAKAILGLALGIAGGVAFLLMVFGAYRLIFAGGNPEAIQQGREIITAAIAGLIVIIFAIFILRLLGITILGLPIAGGG